MDNRTEIWTIQGSTEPFNQSRASTAHIPPSGPTVVNGTDKIFYTNPFLVGVQSKFSRKYYHKTAFAVLILIIVLLIIAIICVAIKAKYTYNVCETNQCLRAASNLILSMDQTVDPCDDFYKFTCGNWHEEHPRPDSLNSYDWFSEKQNKIMRKIRTSLQENLTSDDSIAINKTKIMYRSCMDVQSMDKLKLEPIFKLLKEFKLPLIPSILNRTTNNNDIDNIEEFNLVETLVRVKLAMGMDILVGFDIFPDPANRSINRIAIGTPETVTALPFYDDRIRNKHVKKKLMTDLQEPDDDDSNVDNNNENIKESTSLEYYKSLESSEKAEIKSPLKTYITYIRKIMFAFLKSMEPDINLDDVFDTLNSVAIDLLRVTAKITQINDDAENSTKSSHTNPLEDFVYLTVLEAENVTNDLITPKSLPIWDIYLPLIFQNQSIKFNITTEKLLTSNADIQYLQQLKQYLLNDLSKEKLELYVWWFVIEELIDHTTIELRQYHNEYTRSVLNTESSTPRSLYCTGAVNTLMGMAVSYKLIDENFMNESYPKINDMITNIRNAFNNLVKTTNWMDKKTKEQTLDKSANMKSLIGFPEWLLNTTILDKYYDEIDINKSTHLDNMIDILRWKMTQKLLDFEKPNNFGWDSSPSNVNAFHTFQANTITIPIAILQYPFYELGLEALNYGAIGAILGHELTHGFDDSGRMFDKNGNMRQWWTENTIKEYVNRTECFIKQYGNYKLQDVEDNIDGELTLGENIADNGGLREAYYAYQILKKQIGDEKQLPGLEKYTHEQLLFISFGNLWCETLTPSAAKYALIDNHCPGRIRLKGVLTNSPEFSNTFKCKLGSGMYPTNDRCRIW